MLDPDAPIFKELPETFPEEDKFKKPSLMGSVVFHVILIIAVIIVPLMIPQRVDQLKLMSYLVSPPPPPPAAPPAPASAAAAPAAKPKPLIAKAPTESLVVPTEIPREIARIVDQPIDTSIGVVGGVPGGIGGGIPGGVLGGLLASASNLSAAPPPPPPPPPKAEPIPPAPVKAVRVGGDVREPRVINIVSPVYPKLALQARIAGTVELEATLTAGGTVEEIKVISGHPLLVAAAIDAVKQWRYEPTYLNGVPVPVILRATVMFGQKPTS